MRHIWNKQLRILQNKSDCMCGLGLLRLYIADLMPTINVIKWSTDATKRSINKNIH
jgi:hypothetical protein